MTDMRGLIRLMTWLSPTFPTGAFAYSHGLEWAVENNGVRDEAALLDWIETILVHGAGWNDTILLRLAHQAAGDGGALRDLAALALATAPARERREEAITLGRAFVLAAAAGWNPPTLPAETPLPIAAGALAWAHDIPEDAVAHAFLQSLAANLVSAAVRLIPLGQTAGLRVIAALESTILLVARDTAGRGEDSLGGCAFLSDAAAMRHETQYTRLFRS